MKNYLTFLFITFFLCGTARADLIITAVFDGPITGGVPKGVELYATADVADLSIYAFASVNNGGGIDTIEFTFPAVAVTAGDYIYLASEAVAFNDFFGFSPDYTSGAANINGDDAILLFKNGVKHDIFGDENVDGNGEPWEYLDGWAYRVSGTGPDGSTFVLANWTFSGPNALDGETTNASATTPVPIGTYGGTSPAATVLAMSNNTFMPRDITINVGETVQWDNAGGFHNVNGTTATFSSNPEGFTNGSPSSAAWTYSHTFTIAGFYEYQCDPHVGLDMKGTITVEGPPVIEYPAYDIATVTTTDVDGVPDSSTVKCELTGIIHGENFAGGTSTSFTFIDATGGINCFISGGNNPNGYVLVEGDEITVQGVIGAFNGVTQITPDTFWIGTSGNTLVTPAVVTELNEGTESEMVRINGLTITDPSQWTGSGSGFNVTVTDGTNDYTMRIDNSVDLYSAAAPTGTFDAIGIGSQFDNTTPFITGYQFFPRYSADIILVTPPVTTANDDAFTTSINTDIEIDLLANDILPDSLKSLNIIDMPTLGTLTPSTGSLYNYSPNMDICGMVDMFTYEICDTLDVCDTASVSINILCPSAYPAYDIATVTTVDADGVPDSTGIDCELTGVVHGGDFVGSGSISFTLIDATGGLNCFSSNAFGYTVTEGDMLTVRGEIGQFNGVTQISMDTLIVVSSGNTLVTPAIVTDLNEGTESEMVRINGLSLTDPSQWTGTGSGFNVTVSDGTNSYTMRIDNDVDLYNAPAPTGDFDAIGIGSQFDNSSPFDQGYQFFPRYTADIIPIVPSVITANDDIVVTMINLPVTINVLGNDGLPNGVDTVYIVDNPSLGTVGVNMDNDILYAPDVDVCGEDAFTYAICDAVGCDTATVNVTIECPVTYPMYDIADINTTDADGAADSLGVSCEVSGIVYGVNLRASGLQFTLIDKDDADAGIGLFLNSGNLGYTVTEGDEVRVQGTVGFFNGLVQLNPDTLWLESAGNDLHPAAVVTDLNESTESKLVRIENLTIVDPSEWDNSGPGFNVTVTDGTNEYEMRIDNDVEMYNDPAPTQAFNLTGIGGQFDSESPFLEGYQLLPRYWADIDLINSTEELNLENQIQVYPNPVSDLLELRMEIGVERIQLTNLLGQVILTDEAPEQRVQLDLTRTPRGIYLLTFFTKEGRWTTEVVRQ